MIDVLDVSLSLNQRPIIKDISFEFKHGILAILGLNGSGKTTLLKSLSGLIKPQFGHIKIFGENIANLTRKEIATRIAFVPQEISTFFSFTVHEMVLMGRTPHLSSLKLPTRYDHDIAGNALEEVGISHLHNRQYAKLSGGERRLVLIAMALAQDTNIILLDEPTTFLDLRNTLLILDLINDLYEKYQKSFIITLHDVNQVLMCASQILMLCDLTNYKFGNLHEVINQPNLTELYGIDFKLIYRDSLLDYIKPLKQKHDLLSNQ